MGVVCLLQCGCFLVVFGFGLFFFACDNTGSIVVFIDNVFLQAFLNVIVVVVVFCFVLFCFFLWDYFLNVGGFVVRRCCV